jgi:hypothetical protein
MSSWHDWRTQLEDVHHPVALPIYRQAFNNVGIVLADGDDTVEVTKEEAAARYDWQEGIDLIFTTRSGHRMTAQAKFLTYPNSTATFEEKKTSGDAGAWYYCTAQYYFIGYTRKYWDYHTRNVLPDAVCDFQDWIMLDFAALRRADASSGIHWYFRENKFDGRRSTFRYIYFDDIPVSCIVSRFHPNGYQYGLFGATNGL